MQQLLWMMLTFKWHLKHVLLQQSGPVDSAAPLLEDCSSMKKSLISLLENLLKLTLPSKLEILWILQLFVVP